MTTHDTSDTHARQGHNPLQWVARIGYGARGVVYLVIGGLAVLAAVGEGGRTTGSKGALSSLRDEPLGQALLLVIAGGLVCYSIWRMIQAIKDPDDQGTEAKGLVVRAAMGISSLTHAFLALYAANLAVNFGWVGGGRAGGGGGQGGSAQSWSGWLLGKPGGQWILGVIAAAIAAAGVAQILRGAKRKYRKHFKSDYQRHGWIDPVCVFGLCARGVVFILVGGMFAVAAWQHDKYEAGGLGKGLSLLARQPYGWVLLGVAALGLLSFGVFSFIEARYRRI